MKKNKKYLNEELNILRLIINSFINFPSGAITKNVIP